MEFLNDEAGSQLLLPQIRISPKNVDDDQRRVAREISNELGGNPLDLSYAQGYISLLNLPLKEYLELIRTRSDVLGNQRMDATHDSLLENLPPGAVNLLYMLSFMNPVHISEELIRREHKPDCLDFLRDWPTYVSKPVCPCPPASSLPTHM